MKYKRRKKHSNMYQYRNKQQSWYSSHELERYVADQLKELLGREPDPEEVKEVIRNETD